MRGDGGQLQALHSTAQQPPALPSCRQLQRRPLTRLRMHCLVCGEEAVVQVAQPRDGLQGGVQVGGDVGTLAGLGAAPRRRRGRAAGPSVFLRRAGEDWCRGMAINACRWEVQDSNWPAEGPELRQVGRRKGRPGCSPAEEDKDGGGAVGHSHLGVCLQGGAGGRAR